MEKLTSAMIGGFIAGVMALALAGCGAAQTPTASTPGQAPTPTVASSGQLVAAPTELPSATPALQGRANVIEVSVTGDPGAYSLSVTVASPDTGCDSYADWWEVISGRGELIYRRVLLHSHVSEQPFTRSGGPVDIQPGDIVIIQAHMSNAGYGGAVLAGTVEDGILPAEVLLEFDPGLESQEPLPTGCAF